MAIVIKDIEFPAYGCSSCRFCVEVEEHFKCFLTEKDADENISNHNRQKECPIENLGH